MRESNPLLKNSLLSLLSFLRSKAVDKNLNPVISVEKVIDMLKSTGMHITYQQLADLVQDPIIAPAVASINKSRLTLTLSTEAPTEEPAMSEPEIPMETPPENTEDVNQMPEEEPNEADYMPEVGAEDEPGEGIPGEVAGPVETPMTNTADSNDEYVEPFQKPSVVSTMAKRAMSRPD